MQNLDQWGNPLNEYGHTHEVFEHVFRKLLTRTERKPEDLSYAERKDFREQIAKNWETILTGLL